MDGTAIVYCEGAYALPNGKTANGLVRYTARYLVMGVIDSTRAGNDAGVVLDGKLKNIPIFESVDEAIAKLLMKPRFMVIGLAPDGGRLPGEARRAVKRAIEHGLNVDSGLHEFLGDDAEFIALARRYNVKLRDIRRPPPREQLHFFTGRIEEVKALKLAVLGTDSAIGKRTTAVKLNQALNAAGIKSELIGTGQTSWMQGVKYGFILDSVVNDFVTGELEHAIYQAWINERPEVILLEGQGSIMHPAYPGGLELISAGRVDGIVLQHAPKRLVYDGFEQYSMNSLEKEIQVLELLAHNPVIALTINHEWMGDTQIEEIVTEYEAQYARPTADVLKHGCGKLVERIQQMLRERG
jgi:uncharacterized NAD-dependent epimerase/dehydratase family protein